MYKMHSHSSPGKSYENGVSGHQRRLTDDQQKRLVVESNEVGKMVPCCGRVVKGPCLLGNLALSGWEKNQKGVLIPF